MDTNYAITLCEGTACMQMGMRTLSTILDEQLEKHGLKGKVKINVSGCLGMCHKGPIMVVNPGYTLYGGIKEADVAEIVEEHLVKGHPIARLVIEEDHLFNRFLQNLR